MRRCFLFYAIFIALGTCHNGHANGTDYQGLQDDPRHRELHKIRSGMPKADVEAILGSPNAVVSTENGIADRYDLPSTFGTTQVTNEYYIIYNQNNEVKFFYFDDELRRYNTKKIEQLYQQMDTNVINSQTELTEGFEAQRNASAQRDHEMNLARENSRARSRRQEVDLYVHDS